MKDNFRLPVLLVTFILVLLGLGFFLTHPVARTSKQSGQPEGFAVVELFTSEGCSSCPPADTLLASIAKDYPDDVYVLGFHVDYWDNAQWRDVYSNPAYSSRQRTYAAQFRLNSVYTPQVIVNGSVEMVGSDAKKLRNTILLFLQKKPSASLKLAAKSAGRNLAITYQVESRDSNLLNFALVQLHASSAVRGGENTGRLLHHVNVVSVFQTIRIAADGSGSTQLRIPDKLLPAACRLIAYLQDPHSLQIVAATSLSLTGIP